MHQDSGVVVVNKTVVDGNQLEGEPGCIMDMAISSLDFMVRLDGLDE